MNLEYYSNHPADYSVLAQTTERSEQLCFLGQCGNQMQAGEYRNPFKERVYGLIAELDSDSFRVRENAQSTLLGMDRNVLPFMERELRNPRSAEVAARLRSIYRSISGSEDIRFNGNVGRDGVGRLREIRDNMQVSYRDSPFPSKTNEPDVISYERAGGWNIVRQGDGTYTITQNGNDGKPMETGARITFDQKTGNVRAVLENGSVMIIPPAGPRWWYREGDQAPPLPENN